MSHDMLGIVADFATKLRNGSIAPDEAKRFLRRENPFEPKAVGGFDLAAFMGKVWAIESNRENIPEGWNPKAAKIISALRNGESYITGEKSIQRLSSEPLLGVRAFWHYWNNQADIPEGWKWRSVFFDATVLCGPGSHRASLCLYWHDSRWHWNYDFLDGGRHSDCVSALSAS